ASQAEYAGSIPVIGSTTQKPPMNWQQSPGVSSFPRSNLGRRNGHYAQNYAQIDTQRSRATQSCAHDNLAATKLDALLVTAGHIGHDRHTRVKDWS
ncbi:hypothetical protein ACFQ6H_27150, partial [Rhodococcus sp. NPDC056506]|uniref:hypothetical protein n=1 Tax=Rhodococcus sp. NPDC056506 TaxID=3345844 RepID=UPI00366B15E0